MSITRTDVDHVARLARLELSDDEAETLRAQLSKILDHAARVTSLETEDVEPTSHAISLSNVFRPDEVVLSLTQNEALANAPLAQDGHFRVPRIGGFGGVAAPLSTEARAPEAANPPRSDDEP